jgi:hypothetical protein
MDDQRGPTYVFMLIARRAHVMLALTKPGSIEHDIWLHNLRQAELAIVMDRGGHEPDSETS